MIRAEFAFDPTAVAAARRLVVATLRGWDVPDDIVDDSELVVSELVTNAFTHGMAPSVTIEIDHPAPAVTLTVEHDELAAAGTGGGAATYAPVHATAEQTHGRGLAIVDVLAREWTVQQTSSHRRVWCRFAPQDGGTGSPSDDPLAILTAAVAAATTRRAIGDAVTEWMRSVFSTDFTGIALAEDDGRRLRYLSVEPLPPESAAIWAHFPAATDVPVAAAFRLGRSYFHESGTAAVAGFPEVAPALSGSGMAALAHVPLCDDGTPIGTLSLAWQHGRVLDAADRELIAAVAELTAAAITRT